MIIECGRCYSSSVATSPAVVIVSSEAKGGRLDFGLLEEWSNLLLTVTLSRTK